MALNLAKPRVMDFSRDYGTIYGGAATCYEQDGRTFNLRGEEISPPRDDEVPDERSISEDHLKAMDGDELKLLVESYGGTWKGPAEAVKFLKGQSA